jgi:hypothetical protein
MEMLEHYNVLNNETINPIVFYALSIIGIIVSWLIIGIIYFYKKENNIIQYKIKIIIPIIITGIILYGLIKQKSNELNISQEIYLSGNYRTVEGYVNNFDPMPYGGHKNESFCVNGIYFEYSNYGRIANYKSFNNTKSHGGPIDEGKYIKVDYIIVNIGLEDRNLIMRLLVKE